MEGRASPSLRSTEPIEAPPHGGGRAKQACHPDQAEAEGDPRVVGIGEPQVQRVEKLLLVTDRKRNALAAGADGQRRLFSWSLEAMIPLETERKAVRKNMKICSVREAACTALAYVRATACPGLRLRSERKTGLFWSRSPGALPFWREAMAWCQHMERLCPGSPEPPLDGQIAGHDHQVVLLVVKVFDQASEDRYSLEAEPLEEPDRRLLL